MPKQATSIWLSEGREIKRDRYDGVVGHVPAAISLLRKLYAAPWNALHPALPFGKLAFFLNDHVDGAEMHVFTPGGGPLANLGTSKHMVGDPSDLPQKKIRVRLYAKRGGWHSPFARLHRACRLALPEQYLKQRREPTSRRHYEYRATLPCGWALRIRVDGNCVQIDLEPPCLAEPERLAAA